MGISFFCPSPQSDPTSGVYPYLLYPTHCFLWVVWSFDDDEKNIRPTRHKGIMEKYPPFPKRGLIYRHSSSSSSSYSSSSSSSSSSFRKENARGFMIPRLMGKRISSIRNGSLISKVCQVVFSLMSKMRRIHGYIVASPFVLAREERERDNEANKKMIQMNES